MLQKCHQQSGQTQGQHSTNVAWEVWDVHNKRSRGESPIPSLYITLATCCFGCPSKCNMTGGEARIVSRYPKLKGLQDLCIVSPYPQLKGPNGHSIYGL